MEDYFSFFDLFLAITISITAVRLLKKKAKDKKITNPAYEYYSKGLTVKLIGTFAFCAIYLFYYQGGDTMAYFRSVKAYHGVFLKSPTEYLDLVSSGVNAENWTKFDPYTGYPERYMFTDSRTLLVVRISSLIAIPVFCGFFSTTVLISILAYQWIWRGFLFTSERYPEIINKMAWSFLFIPSVVFWGSGLMKDTYTFASTCFVLYAVNEIFRKKNNILGTSLQLLVAAYLIITIKAYLLFALLPGTLIFINFERIKRIKSAIVKLVVLPLSLLILVPISQSFFINFKDEFGKYSADKILSEAAVQQQDLTRDVYGKNSFDIGRFEPTLQGVVSKIGPAINAAIFRPYIWEVGSPTMLISAVENLIVMIVVVVLFSKIGVFKFFNIIFQDPYLLFCLIFTLTLAFGIGLSTANFGALVRYKIPFIPYFISIFFIMDWMRKSVKDTTGEFEESKELGEVRS